MTDISPDATPAARTVLLLGRTTMVLDEVQRDLDDDVHLVAGTTLADVRAIMGAERVDHVIMGAGLELATRLEVIRAIFEASETTTVHMKDAASGPEGFLPFARGILQGLRRLPRPPSS